MGKQIKKSKSYDNMFISKKHPCASCVLCKLSDRQGHHLNCSIGRTITEDSPTCTCYIRRHTLGSPRADRYANKYLVHMIKNVRKDPAKFLEDISSYETAGFVKWIINFVFKK